MHGKLLSAPSRKTYRVRFDVSLPPNSRLEPFYLYTEKVLVASRTRFDKASAAWCGDDAEYGAGWCTSLLWCCKSWTPNGTMYVEER